MRTTLTLDSDVAVRLHEEAKRSGRPFKTVVNDHLRAALTLRTACKGLPPFQVIPRNMGGAVSGASYDKVSALLEAIEGARHG